MVNLSIDPPSYGRPGYGLGRVVRLFTYLVVLGAGLAGGFYAGRRTAPKAPPPDATAQAAAPAAKPSDRKSTRLNSSHANAPMNGRLSAGTDGVNSLDRKSVV